MEEKYNIEEIKEIFNEYRQDYYSNITDDEYTLFCRALQAVPRNIVDRLKEKVHFVLMSSKKNATVLASILYLEDLKIKNKSHVIIITPILFSDHCIKKIKKREEKVLHILHELAHFHLKHTDYENDMDHSIKEALADSKAWEWFKSISWRKEIKQ